MRRLGNVSLHFTLHGPQTLSELESKLNDWLKSNTAEVCFTEALKIKPTQLHHCFLPIERAGEDVVITKLMYAMLDRISKHKVAWHGGRSQDLDSDRHEMLKYIKNRDGAAIFLGEIRDETKIEYDIAKEIGVRIIEIK